MEKSEEDTDRGNDSEDDEEDEEESDRPVEEESEPEPTLEEVGLKPFPECIIPRAEWGALKPKRRPRPIKHPIPNVIFTYTTDVPLCETPEECVKSIQELQKQHLEKGMADIAFNFVIGGDYRVYEGRGWFLPPDAKLHFPELRGKKLDIGYLGNNYAVDEEELDEALPGLGIDLAHYGVEQGYLDKRYRLLESDEYMMPKFMYTPGKKDEFPDLQFIIEDYYPGNPERKEEPKDLFEKIGDEENLWDQYL